MIFLLLLLFYEDFFALVGWGWVRIGNMDGEGMGIVLDWSEIVVEGGANKKEMLVKLDI